MDASKLTKISCPTCSLTFIVDKDVYDGWAESHKKFHCPNGHVLSFKQLTPKDEEIKKLKAKIQELSTALATQCKETSDLKEKADRLSAELYTWKPRDGHVN